MDITITKNKAKFNKKYLVLLVLAVPAFFVARYLWLLGQADFSIEGDSLVFDEVKRGKFTVAIRGSGVLVPDDIQWLSASVEAKVEKRFVKPGDVVDKGDLIVSLSNPELVQQLAEAKWELEAMEAETLAAKVERETALLELKSLVLNGKLNYDNSVNEYEARSKLVETGAVSKLDYQRAQLEMEQAKQRWQFSQEQFEKMKENLVAQEDVRNARLKQTKKVVERIQQQVDELQVRASITSTVLELPTEPGQRVSMGDNIAKLAKQDSLIAELQVPEIQIQNVAVGQSVVIDTRNNKVNGVVSRVDPAVINGNVQVDVSFTEALPNDARPDLSVDGVIKRIEIEDTLYVSRPLFAQSESRAALYRLTDDGQLAERIEVNLGFGSVNEIQIVEGLSVGDVIVTSDPSRFEIYDKFRIK